MTAECNGLCVAAADIGVLGVPSGLIAYPHPACPEHGATHPFVWGGQVHDTHDGPLRVCECGAYEDEHG